MQEPAHKETFLPGPMFRLFIRDSFERLKQKKKKSNNLFPIICIIIEPNLLSICIRPNA